MLKIVNEKILFRVLSALLLLVISPAGIAQTKAIVDPDFLTTQNYYNKLINSDPLPIAQLNLFANQLPKGGDLHHHYSGALYAETYLDWVEKKGLCIVKASFKINFNAREYETNESCLTAARVRADEIFYRKLLMHWSDKDFANHFHEALPPDIQFFSSFQYFTTISKAFYKDGLQQLKIRAKNENLQYIETMLARGPAINESDSNKELDGLSPVINSETLDPYLDLAWQRFENDENFQNQIKNFIAEIESDTAEIDDADFTLRVQTYVTRNASPSSVFSSMYSGFKAATQSKKVVGLNIVGPENAVVAMRDYSLHMQMFKYFKNKYPDVRLSLHAGELSLGMVPPEGLRNHIRSAVEIAGARRIGHGLDIMYESDADTLLKKISQEKIAVEINLTSNEFIAGVSGQSHPVTIYIQRNIPIVISTDDEGVSRSSISNEYLLFISRYKPSYSFLKNTVYNSIQFSFLSDDEKLKQKKILDQRFARFEKYTAQSVKDFRRVTAHSLK